MLEAYVGPFEVNEKLAGVGFRCDVGGGVECALGWRRLLHALVDEMAGIKSVTLTIYFLPVKLTH